MRVLALAVCAAVTVCGCSKDPEVAKREFFNSAQEFAKAGKLNEAIVQYRNAIQQDPRFGQARLELGRALLKAGDPRGAHREIIRAADLLPQDVDAQVSAGEILLAASQFEDARSRAERALALNPRHVPALVLKGNALASLKQFDAALDQVQAAIDVDPTRSGSYTNLAVLQATKGDQIAAEAAFKRAIDVAPKSLEARIGLAGFYLSAGRASEAEVVLEEARALEPSGVIVNRALAALYLNTKRPEKAEAPLRLVADAAKDGASVIALADYFRATGRIDDALRELDRAASIDEVSFVAAVLRKSAIFWTAGKKSDALGAIEAVLVKRPKDIGALVVKTEYLLQERKVDEALKTALAATTVEPESIPAQIALARVHQARGGTADAIAAYRVVIGRQPSHEQALVELARLSLGTGRPGEALQYAQSAIKLRPGDAEALLLWARSLMGTGQVQAAIQPMKTLADRFPNAPSVQAQLGTLHVLQRNQQGARVAYGRALAIDPSNAEALNGLTALDFAANNPGAAQARVEAALAKAPNAPGVLLVAARTFGSVGDLSRAERHLRRLMDVDPLNLTAYSMLAHIYMLQKRLDAAIGEYERVVEKAPDSVGALTMIGMLLEAQKRLPEAQKRYEAVIALRPDAGVAANNLAFLYAEHGGNLDVALDLARSAKAALPDEPQVSDTLGWILYRKGLYGQALPLLRDSVEKQPSVAIFHYHLGLTFYRTGDLKAALGSFETALKLDPDAAQAEEARALVSRLKAVG